MGNDTTVYLSFEWAKGIIMSAPSSDLLITMIGFLLFCISLRVIAPVLNLGEYPHMDFFKLKIIGKSR